MAEIRWTEEAAKWLQDIYDYISEDNREVHKAVNRLTPQHNPSTLDLPPPFYTQIPIWITLWELRN